MNWFLVALSVPMLSTAGHFIDKYLLTKHLQGSSVGTIALFSCFFSLLLLPVILIAQPNVFEGITLLQVGILMVDSAFYVLSILLYLYAIFDEEVSTVLPYLQIIPVFGFLFSYLILGETLTSNQVLGCIVILLGSILLSFEFFKEKVRIKKKFVFLILGATSSFAFSGVLFKLIALDAGYWRTQFWEYIGVLLFGVLIFAFVKSYRRDFLGLFNQNSKKAIGLNSISELTLIGSDLLLNFAGLLAPLALVYIVNSFQPIFAFAYGIILTLLFPHMIRESLSFKHILHKIIVIALMIGGGVLLYI